METDAFFYRLLKLLPQTFFQLLGLPAGRAHAYRFDSVEVKKAFRIDGLFLPRKSGLPLYFVEVQFQNLANFYANLFAKVFCYLEENDPGQEWQAVAIFPNRNVEPVQRGPYEELLSSQRVWRIYLDEYPMPPDPAPGLELVQLLSIPDNQTKSLADRIKYQAENEIADSDQARKVITLLEEALVRRYQQFDREEIRTMYDLPGIRQTRVFQEGVEEGRAQLQIELVRDWLAKGMGTKEIAELMKISVSEARRLIKAANKE